MAIEELHTYRITCEDMDECDERRSITIQSTDENSAAYQAETQGWAAHLGAGDRTFLCPQHFAAAWPEWKSLGYEPSWVRHHPALP